MSNSVFQSPASEFRVDAGRLINYGPGVVYYRDEAPVTAALNDGSLATGESVTLDGSQWVVSTDRSAVDVIPRPPSAQSGSGALVFGMATATPGPSGSIRIGGAMTLGLASMRVVDGPVGADLQVTVVVGEDVIGTLTIDDGDAGPVEITLGHACADGDLVSVNAASVGSDTAATGVVVQIDPE